MVWRGTEIVHVSRDFGADPLPTLDKGRLYFLDRQAQLSTFGRDGSRIFDTTVLDAEGRAAGGVSSVAADSDGTIAVAVGYSGAQGYAGGIAWLDSSGKQARFVSTGRYMPAHVCFDKDHFLWPSAGSAMRCATRTRTRTTI